MIVFLIIWNIVVFAIYGADKKRARDNKRRVPEKTLIACAFLMGGVGAFLGMRAFRHKTRVLKFKILIALSVAITIAFVLITECNPVLFLSP